MTTSKLLMLIGSILITASAKGQNIDILSSNDYQNILIDNVKWKDVYHTNGNGAKMKVLFGNTLKSKSKSSPSSSLEYWNDSLEFIFEDFNSDNIFKLTYFEVHTEDTELSIKGHTFKIGDRIEINGSPQTNSLGNSGTDIIYRSEKSDSGGFIIKIDPQKMIVTEIKYMEFD